MNSKQKWGRKETIVWPPHAPDLHVLRAWLWVSWSRSSSCGSFSASPRRRCGGRTPRPMSQSLVGATFKQHGKYRLLYVGGGKAAPRLALPADFRSRRNQAAQRCYLPGRSVRGRAASGLHGFLSEDRRRITTMRLSAGGFAPFLRRSRACSRSTARPWPRACLSS